MGILHDTLKLIVERIVAHPEDVRITDQSDDTSAKTLLIHVAEDDIGKIIGKNGRIIRAIRQIMSSVGRDGDERVHVDLARDAEARAKKEESPADE